jgi:hypothetical protein
MNNGRNSMKEKLVWPRANISFQFKEWNLILNNSFNIPMGKKERTTNSLKIMLLTILLGSI